LVGKLLEELVVLFLLCCKNAIFLLLALVNFHQLFDHVQVGKVLDRLSDQLFFSYLSCLNCV
jgi:hypothetical protein